MTRSVAIVGSGPSGCYLAQALLKAQPDLAVDLIDRLPVPYGLVRYGVAPDHQGTKAITRQFERLFERQGAGFIGNVSVGTDVTIDELRAAYDAVVLAAGLSGDRRLGIPGEDLPGVVGAGMLTRALYEHPDAEALPALGPRVVIMGNGNVAIDLLRLLAKMPDELAGSDLGAGPTRWLAESGIETIDIVGRSPAAQAKFDPVMVKELGKLSGVSIRVIDAGASDDPEGAKKIDALASLDGHGSGPRKITFRFGLTPVSLEGEGGTLRRAHFRTEGNAALTLDCSSFIRAIGFQSEGHLPRDTMVGGAVDLEAGVLADGFYATGWFRRGPRGTIPDNRADAQMLASRILADLAAHASASEKPGRTALAGRGEAVDFAGWKRIDAAETQGLPEGRCRVKIASRAEMLETAQEKQEQAR
jgi:ferredoxin--NADP+ reductase